MGITDDSVVNEKIAAYLKDSGPEVSGRETWGKRSVEVQDWSGIICYTPATFTLVGRVPDESGLWASVGMNGHGMAMAFHSAEALVTMMTTGQEPDWFLKSFKIARTWTKSRVELCPKQALLYRFPQSSCSCPTYYISSFSQNLSQACFHLTPFNSSNHSLNLTCSFSSPSCSSTVIIPSLTPFQPGIGPLIYL